MAEHEVVGHDEWIDKRKALLIKEKEFTRLRDELTSRRRGLPWERVDKVRLRGAGGQADAGGSLRRAEPARRLPLQSSAGSDFNFDYGVSFAYLDLVPKGRDEGGRGQFWVRRHDEYGPS